MSYAADIIIVGAGPAGTATAIWASLRGLSVILFERNAFPRFRPGETLHPGVEPILGQLGVRTRVIEKSCVRPTGQFVSWAGKAKFEAFGEDKNGPWRGFQISRAALDEELLTKARELGVTVVQPCKSIQPWLDQGRVVGVVENGRKFEAKLVVDATGQACWLRRNLKLSVCYASSPLRVFYGYRKSAKPLMDFTPRIVGDNVGWEWTARISDRIYHWCRLSFDPDVRSKKPPAFLLDSNSYGPVRGADVTWRHVSSCVGRGYLLAGDAAMILDPAGSHGVLRALMSGIMAAHVLFRVSHGGLDEHIAQMDYQQWLRGWFENDTKELAELYEALNPVVPFCFGSTSG